MGTALMRLSPYAGLTLPEYYVLCINTNEDIRAYESSLFVYITGRQHPKNPRTQTPFLRDLENSVRGNPLPGILNVECVQYAPYDVDNNYFDKKGKVCARYYMPIVWKKRPTKQTIAAVAARAREYTQLVREPQWDIYQRYLPQTLKITGARLFRIESHHKRIALT